MNSEVVRIDSELPQDVVRAIDAGRKIEAIKLLREATGLGLANAKVLVDRASRQRAGQNPQPGLPDQETGLPRLIKSLLVAIAIYAFYRYFVTG